MDEDGPKALESEEKPVESDGRNVESDVVTPSSGPGAKEDKYHIPTGEPSGKEKACATPV